MMIYCITGWFFTGWGSSLVVLEGPLYWTVRFSDVSVFGPFAGHKKRGTGPCNDTDKKASCILVLIVWLTWLQWFEDKSNSIHRHPGGPQSEEYQGQQIVFAAHVWKTNYAEGWKQTYGPCNAPARDFTRCPWLICGCHFEYVNQIISYSVHDGLL